MAGSSFMSRSAGGGSPGAPPRTAALTRETAAEASRGFMSSPSPKSTAAARPSESPSAGCATTEASPSPCSRSRSAEAASLGEGGGLRQDE